MEKENLNEVQRQKRQQQIKAKGFAIMGGLESDTLPTHQFGKIRVGAKALDDAVLNLGTYKKANPNLGNKVFVLQAIQNCDYEGLREISDFFFKTSGIYSRLCRYMAYLYRYDWLVTPYVNDEKVKTEKVLDGFFKCLDRLDNFGVKKYLGDVALKVMRFGCYYGYKIESDNKVLIQELPPNYCRSRFCVNGKPVVEFNMRYFDEHFRNAETRIKILKLFPKEFRKGYVLYKENKLPPEFIGDTSGWYTLDVDYAFKFNLNGDDYPPLVSVIPAIIDLDEAQDLDRKKMQQQLLKIIIQKMPLDKNGDLIFDVDEARDLHNNAVRMLGKAIGIDVLTTFADVDVADTNTTTNTTAADELEKVERTVYNEAGVSQMQFNTDGNIALEKSILNDEAAMYNLLAQFELFLNSLIASFNKVPKKICYKVQLLQTTIYNYKEMSKLFKEHTAMGYSKMLPQIALGQSQSSILANAYFENDILELYKVFIPPVNTNTMNAELLLGNKDQKSNAATDGTEKQEGAGRPEKADDEKSEKTIMNKESQS